MSGPAPNQGGPGMPDPINALQNLASQGSRNPMMNMGPQPGQMGGPQQAPASNLLQTLNRGPSQQMMMGNMGGNMSGPLSMQDRPNMGNMGNAGPMNANQMSSQMANQIRLQQMQSGGMSQMPSHMGNQLQSPIQGQMGGQMQGPMQMGGGMPNQIQNQMMDVEKMSKMKKLLEILSSPQHRVPLDTLIKCEIVLEKIDFKRGDGSVAPPTGTFKEPHAFHALIDALSANVSSPVINHTLHRTFGPTMDTLFGPEIELVPPLKRPKVEEPASDIPDVLQGELARLDQRFKVSLDASQQPGSRAIRLVCCLDDRHLPCVPPVSVTVPDGYPAAAPTVLAAAHEYEATEFLSAVRRALDERVKRLPERFSVSQLLDTWEMSVRQACRGNTKAVDPFLMLMGL